ncbi:hypothetical protein LAZ67_19001373 [Cordylochernes scorpioides]|uniref:Uncharacterized protein n=1 Tax=Cordylochernes scorpioides TaxID=51811 RepID=A0ABY6LLE7_9ARAC|nr:hypothetical protein LAZ67_19001373 [Cordylochernes scorpioides]
MHSITTRVPFSKTLLRIKTSQKHNNSTNLEFNWCGCIPLGILGISYGSCQKIIGEHLNMKKLCSYFAPRNLTDQQRETRLSI